jgi:sulfite reductase beta subunit-like hemoprotein
MKAAGNLFARSCRFSRAEICFAARSTHFCTNRAVGRYELRLGADFSDERMNACYLENAAEAEIPNALEKLFTDFAARRTKGEHFGDFIARTGVVKPPMRRPDRLAAGASMA